MKIFDFGYQKYVKELEDAASADAENEARREAKYQAYLAEDKARKQAEYVAYIQKKSAEESVKPPRKRQRFEDAAARLLQRHQGDVEAVAQILTKMKF